MKENFSPWIKWANRNSLNHSGRPGIYCLAVSETDLSNKGFDWICDLKYIGMTNSRSRLKGRLQQFDNTIKGKTGHGGADRFRFKHQDYEALIKKLYVSIWTFNCDIKSIKPHNLLTMGEVAKAEYVCFAEYVKLHDKLPDFNDKPNAPKYSLTIARELQPSR